MSNQNLNEKEAEKHEKEDEKRNEKSPEEKSWDEKWSRDPLSAVVWAAIFISQLLRRLYTPQINFKE